MQQPPVYLDYNATTPCDPRVVETMLPFFTRHFGNAASRNHAFGWAAEGAVDHARQQLARLIGADAQEIIFTSGATEAVNLGIKGLFEAYAGKGNHIIIAETEHKAVLDTLGHLEKQGASVTRLKVNAAGLISPDELEAAITAETILIAIMYANNETGVIQPMAEISRIAREKGVILFTDGTQAVGKIPLNMQQEGIGMMAFSAHKLYGPKGVGALYVRRRGPRVKIIAQMDGGGHERGMRSGTLNVPAIAGFGKACELAAAEMAAVSSRLSAMRDRLETTILAREHATVNGSGAPRLPHVTNIAFHGMQGDALLRSISRQIAVSSGSACTSANPEPSHVLLAMGVEDELARSSLRFALGRYTTDAEIDFAIAAVDNTIREFNEILK